MVISQTAARLGISNLPSNDQMSRLKYTCLHLELVRDLIKKPIIVLSGFRSKNLNFAVGGSKMSQHMHGEAADIISPEYGTPFEMARAIKSNIIKLRIDQLIYEYRSWVHVSFTKNPRHQVLSITDRVDGYKAGLFA